MCLGTWGWGVSFLLSLAEPKCLVPFRLCFGGKKERRRVPRLCSCHWCCCRRPLPKEEVSPLKPQGLSIAHQGTQPGPKQGQTLTAHPCGMGGCSEVLGGAASSSRAMPTAELMLFIPKESSESAAQGFSSSCGHLRDGEQSPGSSWSWVEHAKALPDHCPIPALSLRWLHPFHTCLPDDQDQPVQPDVSPWDPSR